MESIEILNNRLRNYFGLLDGIRPNYRISWSDDQIEKARVTETEEGLSFVNPRIIERKKYPWIKERYILEKLIPVPLLHTNELVTPLSYECIWVFEDKNSFPLPPVWPAIELILKTLHENLGKKKIYKDPEFGLTDKELLFKREMEITQLEQDLFGNETSVGDALAHDYGVVVPNNYEGKK